MSHEGCSWVSQGYGHGQQQHIWILWGSPFCEKVQSKRRARAMRTPESSWTTCVSNPIRYTAWNTAHASVLLSMHPEGHAMHASNVCRMRVRTAWSCQGFVASNLHAPSATTTACMARATEAAVKCGSTAECSSFLTDTKAAPVIGPDASALVMMSRKGCRSCRGSLLSAAQRCSQSSVRPAAADGNRTVRTLLLHDT